MHSTQHSKLSHTKILEVLRSKHNKQDAKDPRQLLYFKIKPDKSISELIIPYKDLKDNFPYALIDYYEAKMKTKSAAQFSFSNLITSDQNNTSKMVNTRAEATKIGNNLKKKQNNQKQSKNQQKITLEQQEGENQIEGMELIHDYDKYLQDNVHSFKTFHTIFSQNEPIQNRYLKDLKNNENTSSRKGNTEYNLQVRRKKFKIDYAE